MKSAREKMDMVAAYFDVGTHRGAAAALCGTTNRTVKREVLRHQGEEASSEPRGSGPAASATPGGGRGRRVSEVVMMDVARHVPEPTREGGGRACHVDRTVRRRHRRADPSV